MKKYCVAIVILIFMMFTVKVFAMPVQNYNTSGSVIKTGINYNNTGWKTPQAQPINKIIIAPSVQGGCRMIPPPPPPRRAVYRVTDYGGNRQFHKRSYYIPSYCMPETGFYGNYNNPFCSQYRPYGNSFYLSF